MDRSSHSSRSLGVMMTLTLVMLDSATLASRVSGFSSRLTLSSVRQDCTASTSTSGNEKGAKFNKNEEAAKFDFVEVMYVI